MSLGLLKIGIFGGTFDPIHLGHVHLATLAYQALGLDEVRYLPCPISPHKLNFEPAGGEDRCEMIRLAIADDDWAVLDDYELRRPGITYSYQTAEAMLARFPRAQLFWIMGSDQWQALPTWEQPERLAQMVEFAVLTRTEDEVKPRDGYRMHILQDEYPHPASSTGVRNALMNCEPNVKYVNPVVMNWIRERGLYRP